MKRQLSLAGVRVCDLPRSRRRVVVAAAPLSTVTADTSGKWVKYNMATCKYVPTKSLGKKYTAVLTKSAKPYKVAWGTQDTVFPFTLLLNKDIAKQAAARRADAEGLGQQGQRPVGQQHAADPQREQIVAYKPDVNLWMNTLGPLTAKSMSCSTTPSRASRRSSSTSRPARTRSTSATASRSRGSPPPTTPRRSSRSAAGTSRRPGSSAPAPCRRSATTRAARRSGSPTSRPQLRKLLPGIPANQVTLLDCNTTPDCRTAMADWITAHPQAKYITGATVYDIRSLGAYAALKAAGFKDNAVLVGNGLEPAAKALVDAERPDHGLDARSGRAERREVRACRSRMDILAGKPVPTGTYIPVSPYCGKRCGK